MFQNEFVPIYRAYELAPEPFEHPAGLGSPNSALQARDLDQQPRPVDGDALSTMRASGPELAHQRGDAHGCLASTRTVD